MIESAKKLYISTTLSNTSGCPKKFWRNINQLLKGNKSNSQDVTFFDDITKTTIAKGSEPDFLNDFFCNISTRLGLDHEDHIPYIEDSLNIYSDLDDVFGILNDPPTINELIMYSDDIDLSKGSCVDGISISICKDLLLHITDYFLELYLTSIRSGVFPKKWSIGTVTVIPKSGDLSDPSNWRPITQTPIFAKVFEKIIHNRLINYFTDNNILTQYQYGFRKGKSTQQAIFDLTKYIYSGLNHKKLIGAVCLDVAKAFDCINHDILLVKMSKIGFNALSLKWFKSYLTRTQVVKYNDLVSSTLPVKTGIGQGTILGPLLFIFYINDIISTTQHLKINMYADDCILYSSGNDWNKMILNIQPELDNIQKWCDNDKLRLNVNKSKSLIFGSRNKLGKVDYSKTLHIAGIHLKFVDKYKYLGVNLDKELTLNSLLSDVKKSVLQKLFTLRKLRYYITEKTSLSIYKQTILPIFDYAGFMLIACNKSDRNDLQVIQNDALRTCYNVKRRDRLSISKMHKTSNLLSLEQRRTFQLLGLMFCHKDSPLNLRRPVRITRGAARDIFHVERFQNCKYKNSPFYKGANLWKRLPDGLANNCDTLFQFKQGLKKKYRTYVDI